MKLCISLIIVILIFFLGITYVIYDIVFSGRKRYRKDEYRIPSGEQYETYSKTIRQAIENMKKEKSQEVSIVSYDGLRLVGKYYHYKDNAPMVLFFHGYRCNPIRDGNGMFSICKNAGYNMLFADQRAHGKSQGRTITFGIKERYDCRSWLEYIVERFGMDVEVVLAGLSMGAATVLMAADFILPKNVKGIVADCGYSAPSDVIKQVIRFCRLPVSIAYPWVRWSGRIFGGFDIEEHSAREALKKCQIPVLFIHGEDDRFVPCSMSEECEKSCYAKKQLIKVAGAGHGLSYCVDKENYEKAVLDFLKQVL